MLLRGSDNAQKLPFPLRGLEPQSNTWFLRPTQVIPPNGISTGTVVSAWVTNVTNRQTLLSVAIGGCIQRLLRCGLMMHIILLTLDGEFRGATGVLGDNAVDGLVRAVNVFD